MIVYNSFMRKNSALIVLVVGLLVIGLGLGLSYTHDGSEEVPAVENSSPEINAEIVPDEVGMPSEREEVRVQSSQSESMYEPADVMLTPQVLVANQTLPRNLPFREAVLTLYADTDLDVRVEHMSERGDTSGLNIWYVEGMDKSIGHPWSRMDTTEYFFTTFLEFWIYEDANDFERPLSGLVGYGTSELFGVTWNYYSYQDEAGAFERKYTYEKDGSLIMFHVTDGAAPFIKTDKYPAIEDLPRIQYLKYLPL